MSDQTLLAAYRTTRWEVHLPSARIILTLDRAAPEELRPGGIITGYNPESVLEEPEQNRAANQALRHAPAEVGARVYPTVAGDGEWREPGFASTEVERTVLVQLGEQWRQNAIVWVDAAGRATLVVTRSGFCGRKVGEVIA